MRSPRLTRTALSLLILPGLLAGCSTTSVYKKAITLGVQVVGDTVQEAEVDAKGKELVGRPATAADQAFGLRAETFTDTRTPRVLMVYPVKGDITNSHRWIVESENDRIVALAKAIRNPDIGEDQAKSFVLKEMLEGKTSREIAAKDKFRKLVLVLRRQSNGRLVRVYDFTGMMDVLDARYCLIEFDDRDRMTELRLVGVPASSGNSAVGRR